MFYQFATCTHVSFFRKRNEDRAGIFFNRDGDILLALCDGMGGHVGGKEASNLALKVISEQFRKCTFEKMDDNAIQEWIIQVIDKTQQKLVAKSQSDVRLNNMGTTLVACLILQRGYILVINVGDSRAYLSLKNKITQLTEDQNLQNLINQRKGEGGLENVNRRLGNALYSALGPAKQMHIDIFKLETIMPGTLILCSDGLYGFVNKERIHFTCLRNITAQQKAISLIDEALKNNTKDNSTIIIADIISNSG